MGRANRNAMLIDPYPHYAAMRANAPVHFNATLGMWEVYRYHDIQAVLGDPHTFSSDLSALQTLATMDPPRHTQLRRLVARAFTQKLMTSLEPSIAAITRDLLDRVAPLCFAAPVFFHSARWFFQVHG